MKHQITCPHCGALRVYRTTSFGWRIPCHECRRRLTLSSQELGDIIFRVAVVASAIGRSDEARLLAARANDLWKRARMSRQDRLARRKQLQEELGIDGARAQQ
jgi:hypothetical protein